MGWVIPSDTYSYDIGPNLDRRSEYDQKNFPNFSEACDTCNPRTTVFKWFEDF